MTLTDYKILLRRLFLAFTLFVLLRSIFYFYNLNYFSPFGFGDILFAFFYGLRFDLATTLIANLFFIITSLIPIQKWWYQNFVKSLFIVFNFSFLAINIVDLEFFTFLGKKMTFDIFDIGADIQNQSFQLIFHYWYLTLLAGLVMYILFRFYPVAKRSHHSMRWFQVIILSLGMIVLTGIGIRGGLQLRSLSPKEAFIHAHYELGNLSLNAAYAMVRSIGSKGMKKENFFKTDQEAKSHILEHRLFNSSFATEQVKQNVVIIIVESLSQEYIDKGYAPFISKLTQMSLYFDKNLANGRRSIEALPSIMTGFPSIIGKPLYQTQYQTNQFYALPKILKQHKYQTAFFHGGKKGTMDFDAYCYSIGFDKYYSKDDYPNQNHFDGNWGIFDHHYLNFFREEISKYQEPFFATIFTLSSHQPYTIPPEFKGKFPKGSLEIHESIGYVDFALKEFFEKAKKESWYQNTLFVLTADHTQKLESKEFNNLVGTYRVPLIFFHPQKDLSTLKIKRITQQADILPSILDFLGIESQKKLLFGSSVFSQNDGRGINYINGNYFYFKNDYVLRFDRSQSKLQKINADFSTLENVEDQKVEQDLLQELKAYIQYTNNGLRQNNIYDI